MLNIFAKYISYIFEPFTFSFLTLLLVITNLDLNLSDKSLWLILAIVLMGLPPLWVYFYEKRIGKIKDWFMTNRVERRDVQFAWFFGALLFSLTAGFFEAPRLLLALALTIFTLSLFISLITLYWKISVHMMGVTLFVTVAVLVQSPSLAWLFLLVPLVAWARIRLKAHTYLQAALGTLLTFTATYFTFTILG